VKGKSSSAPGDKRSEALCKSVVKIVPAEETKKPTRRLADGHLPLDLLSSLLKILKCPHKDGKSILSGRILIIMVLFAAPNSYPIVVLSAEDQNTIPVDCSPRLPMDVCRMPKSIFNQFFLLPPILCMLGLPSGVLSEV